MVTNPAAIVIHGGPRVNPQPVVAVDSFNFDFVVSSAQTTGSFRIVSGGTGCDDFKTDLSGVVAVPNTGGWQNYQTLTV